MNDIIVYRNHDTGSIVVSMDGGQTVFEPAPFDSIGRCTVMELPDDPSARGHVSEVWRSGPDA